MFTLYELDRIPTVLVDNVKYMVYQKEQCPETGRIHYQGYLELNNSQRMSWIKTKVFGTQSVHLEKRNGTQDQAIDYCMKEETRVEPPVEIGTRAKQGNRTDVENAVNILKQGGKLINILDENPALFIRNFKGLEAAASLLIKQKLGKVVSNFEVRVYWGPTGTGKTWKALHHTVDTFMVPTYCKDKIWFNGYDGESTIIFDEFHGQLDFNLLKRILDKYVIQVETKGSFKYSEWTTVILTSNKHPMEWYPNQSIEEWEQLKRRLNVIEEMKTHWDEVGRSGQVILDCPQIESDAKVSDIPPVPLFEDNEPPPLPGNQLEVFNDLEDFIELVEKPRILKKKRRRFLKNTNPYIDDEAFED